jgi:ATP-dependent protease HslVU (ClpYQ) ATPase subunit
MERYFFTGSILRLLPSCSDQQLLLYYHIIEQYSFFHREHAPSIIFMDEIDSIGSARMESGNGNGDSEVQRTMLELLNQLDGFEASNKIKVIHLLCIEAIVY